jgi:hypothetical protein
MQLRYESVCKSLSLHNLAAARCPDLASVSTGRSATYAILFGRVCPTHLFNPSGGPTSLHDMNDRPAHPGSTERSQHAISPTESDQASQIFQASDANSDTLPNGGSRMNCSSAEAVCPQCRSNGGHCFHALLSAAWEAEQGANPTLDTPPTGINAPSLPVTELNRNSVSATLGDRTSGLYAPLLEAPWDRLNTNALEGDTTTASHRPEAELVPGISLDDIIFDAYINYSGGSGS